MTTVSFSPLSGGLRYASGRIRTLTAYWSSLLLAAFGAPMCYYAIIHWSLNSGLGAALVSGGQSYQTFASVGLMIGIPATTAAGYGMWPVNQGLNGSRRYHTALSAPLSPSSIAMGEWLAVMVRMALQCAGYLVVGMLLGMWSGLTASIRAYLAALLAANVIFLLLFAITLIWRSANRYFFALNALVITPLMMVSGTWCEVSVLPEWIQRLVWVSPMWHAAQWARGGGAYHLGILLAGSVVMLVVACLGMRWRLTEFPRQLSYRRREVRDRASRWLAIRCWISRVKLLKGWHTDGLSRVAPPNGALAVWRRGMAAMTSRAALALLPSSLVMCACYLLVFGPAMRDPENGIDGHTLGAGLVSLMILNGAFNDCMDALFARLHLTKVYRNLLMYLPISPRQVLLGDVLTATTRACVYALGAMCLIIPVCHIPLVVGVRWLAGGVLAAVSLSVLCMAVCSSVTTLSGLSTVRFLLLPMFVFSGAVFPLDGMPSWVQTAASFTPVWRIADLLRGLAAPSGSGQATSSAVYLIGLILACGYLAHRKLSGLERQ